MIAATQVKKLTLTQIFGANVRYRRRRLGIKQSDLADKMGVTCYRISEIERCRYSASLETIERLAKALKTTPDALLVPNEAAMREWEEHFQEA